MSEGKPYKIEVRQVLCLHCGKNLLCTAPSEQEVKSLHEIMMEHDANCEKHPANIKLANARAALSAAQRERDELKAAAAHHAEQAQHWWKRALELEGRVESTEAPK